MLAGLGATLAGLVVGYLLPGGFWSEWAPGLGAYLAAAVAAWVTAFRLGGSPSSATGLFFLALLLAFFLDSLLEYAWLLNLAMSPYSGAELPEAIKGDLEASLWKFSFLVSFLNIPLGAVLGLLLGRPKMPPRI